MTGGRHVKLCGSQIQTCTGSPRLFATLKANIPPAFGVEGLDASASFFLSS